MAEFALLSAFGYWAMSIAFQLIRPDSKWPWFFKGDAALCLLTALVLYLR